MAYSTHHLFVMGGELDAEAAGSWDEVWECTVRGLFTVTTGTEATWLAAQQAALWTWFGASTSYMNSLARISYIKLNQIDPSGRYHDPAHPNTLAHSPTSGAASITTGNSLDESVVYSWTTANLRGPGSRGRIYPPNLVNRAAAGGMTITPTSQTQQVTAAKALLTQLNTVSGGAHFEPCIASKVDGSVTPITGVRVGKVIDVQRRRRNKLAESYVASPWP